MDCDVIYYTCHVLKVMKHEMKHQSGIGDPCRTRRQIGGTLGIATDDLIIRKSET